MRFSQSAEYALRSLYTLAKDPDSPRTVQSLAAEAHIPVNYLSKLMQGLRRADLVKARRGARGGFQLAKSPYEISLLDIVQVVETSHGPYKCPAGHDEHESHLCPLHQRLETCRQSVEGILRESSLGALLEEGDTEVTVMTIGGSLVDRAACSPDMDA